MWCLGFANPWQCYIAEQSSYKAIEYAEAQYGNDGVINGHHDAFRHAIWNGLMTRDLGAWTAQIISTKYEYRNPIPPVHIDYTKQMQRDMDLYNNKVGYNMYTYNKSDAELIRDLRDGFRIHRLGIIILGPHLAFGNTHY